MSDTRNEKDTPSKDPEDSDHCPKAQFCIVCEKITPHRYMHRSWTCTKCSKDEWL